jgi:hypothetical protein
MRLEGPRFLHAFLPKRPLIRRCQRRLRDDPLAFSLNLRPRLTQRAVALCTYSHVCELQLILLDFARLKASTCFDGQQCPDPASAFSSVTINFFYIEPLDASPVFAPITVTGFPMP